MHILLRKLSFKGSFQLLASFTLWPQGNPIWYCEKLTYCIFSLLFSQKKRWSEKPFNKTVESLKRTFFKQFLFLMFTPEIVTLEVAGTFNRKNLGDFGKMVGYCGKIGFN